MTTGPSLAESSAESSTQRSGGRHATLILAIACAAQFMVVLDVSIVNVALPTMRTELHLSAEGMQWIVNAYTLGFAGLLLLGGRAADLVGAKRAFLAGLTLFTTASFAGGLATSGTLLIIARAVQGVGGAVLAPATLTLIMTTFVEPRARTRAMGMWSAVMAAGGAAGAVIGGVLTQYAGWRWVLFVNVPIGVVLLILAIGSVPAFAGGKGGLRHLDLPGTFTVTGGLTALVYGIISTETHGPASPDVWLSLVIAAVLLVSFFVIESRVAHPLVPLGILRRRTLAGANVIVLFIGAAMFAMWYILTLFMQEVLDYSAVKTGLCFMPGALMLIVGAQVATRLVGRTGPRPLMVGGLAVSTIGFAWLSQFTPDGNFTVTVMIPFLLCTLGMGFAMTPVTVAATSGVERHEAGLASGLVNTSRQMGGAIGLAVLATVASHTTADQLAAHPHDLPGALTDGYGRALLYGAIFAAVAAVGSLSMPGRQR